MADPRYPNRGLGGNSVGELRTPLHPGSRATADEDDELREDELHPETASLGPPVLPGKAGGPIILDGARLPPGMMPPGMPGMMPGMPPGGMPSAALRPQIIGLPPGVQPPAGMVPMQRPMVRPVRLGASHRAAALERYRARRGQR